ncbi:hypothetical protein AVEN_244843-1, partial [Araneus ventricosus]
VLQVEGAPRHCRCVPKIWIDLVDSKREIHTRFNSLHDEGNTRGSILWKEFFATKAAAVHPMVLQSGRCTNILDVCQNLDLVDQKSEIHTRFNSLHDEGNTRGSILWKYSRTLIIRTNLDR